MVDWQLVAKLIYDAVLVAVCFIAIRFGGFDERVGIGIVMGASGATSLALPIGLLIGVHSRYIVIAINLGCLAALDALMVRSRSFWPMWATGAQLAGVSVDAAMLLMPVEAGPYVAIRGKFAYGVLLPLLMGALAKRKRTARHFKKSGEIRYGG